MANTTVVLAEEQFLKVTIKSGLSYLIGGPSNREVWCADGAYLYIGNLDDAAWNDDWRNDILEAINADLPPWMV